MFSARRGSDTVSVEERFERIIIEIGRTIGRLIYVGDNEGLNQGRVGRVREGQVYWRNIFKVKSTDDWMVRNETGTMTYEFLV